MPGSRDEYERRIHRVVAHIDAHLDAPLDLNELAGVAHFSPFHFHRVFHAWAGETLGDYVRRRRLEMGALRLVTQPRSTVLEIALAMGFGSGEAFSRAFRQRFAMAPSAWREMRKRDQGEGSSDQDGSALPPDDGGFATPSAAAPAAMNVNLIDMPATPVAYFRHTGPYGPPVGRFWMEQVAPWLAENDLFGRERYGIGLDDPTITAPERCRYDACVALGVDAVVSGRPLRQTLPGGRYACTGFEGTTADIDAAWRRLLGEWLPASGLQLDARPLLEHYPVGSRYDAASGVFDCRLCLPVVPL